MKLKNSQLLLVRQLDKKLGLFQSILASRIPDTGWIATVRKTLNMSLRQTGQRMGMSAQGIKDLEKREADGSISLNSLSEAGNALKMKLVYGFVPQDGSLEFMIEKRAHEMALKIVQRTSVTMALEDQANTNERVQQAVDELTQELKREIPKSLWD